jgi:3-oxoacyl-[acyl-carrier protein] reductase
MTQSVIVSGGSKGLGLAICRNFLDRGFFVGSFARSSTPEVDVLRGEFGENYYFREVDVSNSGLIRDFVSQFVLKFDHIDYLINNAAVGQDSLFVHLSDEDLESLVNINILGMSSLTRTVLKRMALQDSGSIIFVSSICASKGYSGLSVYAGTKGFVDSFARSLVVEYRGRGIKFNTVAPGFFESDMSSSLSSQQLNQISSNTPSGRLTRDFEVVQAIEFMTSGDLNLNGARIVIDGGVTA